MERFPFVPADGARLELTGDIIGFTLPGFATGTRTKGNALRLMRGLGVT